MVGIGFLALKMTMNVLRGEKREQFREHHEEIELSVSCRILRALKGSEDLMEMLKSSAKRRWVRGKWTHLVMSSMAIRKSSTLKTSPWGTPF